MSETVQVNFAKPIPLFPLPYTVLLPHALLPLQVVEARYRQMISHCLDMAGQIAIGTYDLRTKRKTESGLTPLRNAVCVGQIVEHDSLADGRYNIWLHGVCRARITNLLEPGEERTYRVATLTPLEPLDRPPVPIPAFRRDVRSLLDRPRLRRLRGIDRLVEWIDCEEVPTHALLELIGFAVVRDPELKYQLLAEADARRRASLIKHELVHIDEIVLRADRQSHHDWPKGMSWN